MVEHGVDTLDAAPCTVGSSTLYYTLLYSEECLSCLMTKVVYALQSLPRTPTVDPLQLDVRVSTRKHPATRPGFLKNKRK